MCLRFLSKRRISSSVGSSLSRTPSSRINRLTYSFQSSPVSRRTMLFIAAFASSMSYRRRPSCRRAVASVGDLEDELKHLVEHFRRQTLAGDRQGRMVGRRFVPGNSETHASSGCRRTAKRCRAAVEFPRSNRPTASESTRPAEAMAGRLVGAS